MSDATIVLSHPTAPLTVGDGPIELLGYSISGRTWRRRTVEGPYTHGRVLIGAVLDTPTLTVTARLTGDDWADVRSTLALVQDVTAQFNYTATVTVLGAEQVWTCEPADIFEGQIDRWHAKAAIQDITLSIPINPIPVTE